MRHPDEFEVVNVRDWFGKIPPSETAAGDSPVGPGEFRPAPAAFKLRIGWGTLPPQHWLGDTLTDVLEKGRCHIREHPADSVGMVVSVTYGDHPWSELAVADLLGQPAIRYDCDAGRVVVDPEMAIGFRVVYRRDERQLWHGAIDFLPFDKAVGRAIQELQAGYEVQLRATSGECYCVNLPDLQAPILLYDYRASCILATRARVTYRIVAS